MPPTTGNATRAMTFNAAMLYLLVSLGLVAGAHYFQRLGPSPIGLVIRSIAAGSAAAILYLLFPDGSSLIDPAIFVAFAGSILVAIFHRALDPLEGNHAGAITGISAAAIVIIVRSGDVAAMTIASLLIVTPTAAALLSLMRRSGSAERALWAAGVFLTPVAAELLRRSIEMVDDSPIMIAAILFAPCVAMAIFLSRRGSIALELAEEARLGFLDDSDAAIIAHPLRRLRFSGWHNREARRHFIRVAETLAETKILQRSMPEPTARLTQLEVLRLRMRLREIENVERATRPHDSSSTMHLDDSHE